MGKFAALVLFFGLVAAGQAQVSPHVANFIEKFSYAATLLPRQGETWPKGRIEQLGEAITPLAAADDQTVTQSFELLDKNKSAQRRAVANVLLILMYEVKIEPVKSGDYITYAEPTELRDGITAGMPGMGQVDLDALWPWMRIEGGGFALNQFAYAPGNGQSLVSRLDYFRNHFKRRVFKAPPVYRTNGYIE